MKKALLIGIILGVVAFAGIGAAYATGMGFTNVHALSGGLTGVSGVNVTEVTYSLTGSSSIGDAVVAIGLKFDTAFNGELDLSVRSGASAASELAYFAANGVNCNANQLYWFQLTLVNPAQPVSPRDVNYIGVVVNDGGTINIPVNGFVGPGGATGSITGTSN